LTPPIDPVHGRQEERFFHAYYDRYCFLPLYVFCSGFQWLIFAMCFVIVLLDGFDTAAIGYIAPR